MIQSSQVKGQPFNMKATTIEQIRIARANGLDPNNVDVSQLYKSLEPVQERLMSSANSIQLILINS